MRTPTATTRPRRFPSRRVPSRLWVLTALCLLASPRLRAQDAADTNAFHADLAALAARPHRRAGTEDGSRAASHYVEARLKAMGFDEVHTQEFPAIQPISTECRLVADGAEHAIFAVRPNVLQASVTPADGLRGQTLYVGKGRPEDYGDTIPEGRIVVLDFDSGINWKHAFALGACAVLFVEGDGPAANTWHHVNIPANLPRFYVPADTADALQLRSQPREVTLYAACQWVPLRGRNVIAVLRGTDARADADSPAEAIVLAAPLDSYSEVPALAPGARDAANAAGLLQCARYFANHPPRRDMFFCFFDGQTLRHAGARAFYGALGRRLGGMKLAKLTLDERLQALGEQLNQIQDIEQVLAHDDMFSEEARAISSHRDAVRALSSEARTMSGHALELLRQLRLDRGTHAQALAAARKQGADARIPELEQAVEDLSAAIAEAQVDDLGWNSIQRDLDSGHIEPASQARFTQLVRVTSDWCRRRDTELHDAIATCESDIVLRDSLGPDRDRILLHISLDLGDARTRWGFVHGDDSVHMGADAPGIYAGIFKVIRDCHAQLADATRHFETRTASPLYDSRAFAPGLRVDSGGIARLFGFFNLAVATVSDRLPRQGQPADTLEALDATCMAAQFDEAIPFLRALADRPDLAQSSPLRPNVRYTEITWSANKAHGPTVRQIGAVSAMRAPPVRDAMVALLTDMGGPGGVADPARPDHVPPGFEDATWLKTNADGMLEIAPDSAGRRLTLAATFTPARETTGSADHPPPETRGLISAITCKSSLTWPGDLSKAVINLCRIRSMSMVSYGQNFPNGRTTAMQGLASVPFPADQHLLCDCGNVLVLFAPYNASRAKLFNLNGPIALANAPTKAAYQGEGIPLDDPFVHPVAPARTAHDLRTLNTYRLNLLRENRIRQDSLETLNGLAADTETDALAADTQDTAARLGSLEAAVCYSRRAYWPLVGVLKDLVTAVVWLLLLAIPFAYALERLLIGTPHIYRQIGWFGLFFILTFATLYMVNPAFRLAATPIIIFLAFTIVLLSALVIYIMVRKLQTEVQRMQGLSASAHSADISRLTTMSAAVHMGISTMRRRPVRTFLTTLTVILLTFTILTFSSFGNYWGTRTTYTGPMRGLPPRVLVRDPLWNPIANDVYETVKGYVSRDADVVPRIWLAPTMWGNTHVRGQGQSPTLLASRGTDSDPVPIDAGIGISTDDIRRQPRLAAQFAEGTKIDALDADGIILTHAVSEALGLTAQDIGSTKVFLAGLELTYVGDVRDDFAGHHILDGASILPVDYAMSGGGSLESFQQQQSRDTARDSAGAASTQFVCYNLDQIVIVPPHVAEQLGGQIRSLCIYPKDTAQTEAIAQRVATVTGLEAYAGSGGGVNRNFFMSLLTTRGWRDLLIPVLLGSLIIFATMLGSITDREREIYTFSAVGLAPAHVAGLFFAEATVYAVVGGMGGYLIGQIVVRVMDTLATHFLLPVPTLNYSSMNVIVTLLVVMATILVSTVYPAIKASRSANPGVQRAWHIPEPDGALLDILFPFTVSAYDFTGVVSFLKEHFDTHMDTFLGVFAASGTRIFRQAEGEGLGIRCSVALAPFDLGVEQEFLLFSQPSDIEGVDEVRILLRRTAGAPRDWFRANRVFINDMRKQFLLWRSLSQDVTELYRDRTAEGWDQLPVEAPESGHEPANSLSTAEDGAV